MFHCIYSNDFDVVQMLKDLHIDMVKVFPKVWYNMDTILGDFRYDQAHQQA